MRLHVVQLQDFMSHGKTSIDLFGAGLVTLTGNNGAGKSAILEAITYALWGYTRAKNIDDVVKRGTGSCLVSVVFSVGDEAYMVRRGRTITGRGSTTLEFAQFENYVQGEALGAELEVLTGSSIKETQRLIDETIRFSREAFVSSAFLMQGDAGRFTDSSPGDRKQFMAQLLGVDGLEKTSVAARARARDIQQDIELVESAIDIETRNLPDIEWDDVRAHMDELEDLNVALASAEEDVSIIDKIIDAIEGCNKDIKALRVLNSSINAGLGVAANALRDTEIALADVNKVVENQEVITERYAVYLALKEESKTLGDARWAAEKVATLKAKIDAEGGRLTESCSGLEELIAEETALTTEHREISGGLEDARSVAATFSTVLLGARQSYDEQQNAIREQNELVTWENANLQTATENLSVLKDGVCPTCKSTVSPDSDIVTDLHRFIKLYKQNIADVSASMATLAADGNAINDRIMAYEKEESGAEFVIASAPDTLIGIESRLARASGKIHDIHTTLNILSDETYAVDKRHELSMLGDVHYDEKRYFEVAKQLAAMGDVRSDMTRLEMARSQLPILVDQKQEREGRKIEAEIRLADTMAKLIKREDELAEYSDMETVTEELGQKKVALSLARQAVTSTELLIQVGKTTIENKRTKEIEIKELKSGLKKREKKLTTATYLALATGKSGAQALLIEAALPQIEKDASEMLSRLLPNTSVRLESQKAIKTGAIRETLDVMVIKNGTISNIESLSGGERFRVDLAIRAAISLFVARSYGGSETLMIDEGFGSQDSIGRIAVVEAIASLMDVFSLVVVITHIQEIVESLSAIGDNIIVKKIHGNSEVYS